MLVFGASGTIGQAVVRALLDAGYQAVGFMRRSPANERLAEALRGDGAEIRFGDVIDPQSVTQAFEGTSEGKRIDAVISCIASRTGSKRDADRIDFQANLDVLDAADAAGVKQFVLLSAICVQKPRLAFQHAKLRFERRLQVSGLNWSIVRPTAFFKSLSGQAERVKAGKPFLLFGDGELTRCKPISDADLARFIVECLSDPAKQRAILPVGGPGPAISLKEQGEMLLEAAGKPARFRSVPVGMFSLVAGLLTPFSWVSGWAAEKREYARIGRYYATESMLVWDPKLRVYSAEATPEYGSDTLAEHYRQVLGKSAKSKT